jgi:molybdenum cofactor biosynthesis enzyme MoaA
MINFEFVSEKDYRVFAGPSWPSYQEFQSGTLATEPHIQQEIHEFVAKMYQTYQELNPDTNTLALENQQRQNQVFFDKKYRANACRIPWQTLGINAHGNAFICSSPSWIPKFIGNIVDAPDIWSVLNSETAQKIRQEIYHGRYYYCNNKLCAFFQSKRPSQYQYQPVMPSEPLPFESRTEYQVTEIPGNLIFDFDYTCNFRCPSCRTELINNNKHHVIRQQNNLIVQRIKTEIIDQIHQQPVSIRWAGGEPFISEPYLDLLKYISQSRKPNITHIIQTNGSYLKNKQDLLQWLLPSVSHLRISFDAANKETYAKTRVGGVWATLLDNVHWIQQYIHNHRLTTKISADFVVQADNYKEIPDFEILCQQLGIKTVHYQKMWNWGTWPTQQFEQNNVYNPQHSEYPRLLEIFHKIGKKVIDESTQ